MIGIICNNLDAGGGLEVVTIRLFEIFLKSKRDIKLYSCKKSIVANAFSFNLNNSNLHISQIHKIINQLKYDNIDNLIVQLSGPYDFLANKKFFEYCKKNEIFVYVVIHNSPKSFITRYRNVLDNLFIHILKTIRTIFILKYKYRRLFKNISKNATFITLSEGNKNELERYYKIKSYVIPNFFEEDVINNNPILLKKHSLAYIGRIDFLQKNLTYLLDSWNIVENKQDWILNIIGTGNEKELKYLYNYIKRYNIHNINVHGRMNQDQIKQFLSSNAIVLLSSYFEGFPTVVLEAASYENTFVINKFDGFSDELLKNNINSYVVSSNNKKEFAKKIQILLDNSTLRMDFQKQIYKEYSKYIKFYNVVKMWELIFKTSKDNIICNKKM